MLKLLASQAAIALENARLYRDLADREAKIRRFVDANIIGIVIFTLDGQIVEANEAFLRMVGYDRADLAAGGLRWTDMTPPEWRDRDARTVAELKMIGTVQPFEKEYFRKDGSRVPVLIGSTFQESENQGVAFVLDLTERKRAEAEARESERRYREVQMELAHANRVATMGQLSASIAHEVRQPIAASVGNAQAGLRWLSAQPSDLAEVRQALERIVQNGMRANDVIGRIRAMIKKAPSRNDLVDINEAIREVIEFTRGEAEKNGASVQMALGEGLPLIEGDRVQLQQVVLNLIVNAVQAMGAVAEGPRELFIATRPGRTKWRDGRSEGFRSGSGAGGCRAPLRGLLHDEARRVGDGAIDLPFDHRSSWGPVVGDCQPAPGRHFSLHGAHPPGQRIVIRQLPTVTCRHMPTYAASWMAGCNGR